MRDTKWSEKIFNLFINGEIKTVGEIAEIFRGGLPKASLLRPGEEPAIRLGDISKSKTPFIYNCKTFLDGSNIKNKRRVKSGDILLIQESGSKTLVGKPFLYLGEKECALGGSMYVIRHKQNPKYLFHALNSPQVQQRIQIATGNKHMPGLLNRLQINDLINIRVPIPPIEIQEKIANYLDNLLLGKIQLEESLQKMLDLRKKQYEYYKELILISEIDKWDIVTISEIAIEIFVGGGVTSEHLGTGNFPAVKNKDLSYLSRQFYECSSFVDPNLIKNKKYFEYGDILISNMGGQKGVGQACVYLGKDRCIAGNHVIVIKHKQNPKFLAYMLSSQYCRKQISKYAKGTTVRDLKLSDTKKIEIPLPSLEEQGKIVSLIDQFNFKFEELNEYVQELIVNRSQQFDFLSKKFS